VIFICYRRDDSIESTSRIYEWLQQRLAKDYIFMDVSSVPLGVNWRQLAQQTIGSARLVLVIIGNQWLSKAPGQETPRIHQAEDNVRYEIETALGYRIPIIPILVQGAVMPSEYDMPPSLRPLADVNALPVRPALDFQTDMERLAEAIKTYIPNAPFRRGVKPATQRTSGWTTGVGALVAVLLLLSFAILGYLALSGRNPMGGSSQSGSGPQPTATPTPSPSPTPTPTPSPLNTVNWLYFTYPNPCDSSQQTISTTNGQGKTAGDFTIAIGTPVYGDVTHDGIWEALVPYQCVGADSFPEHVFVYTGTAEKPRLLGILPLASETITWSVDPHMMYVADDTIQLQGRGYSPTAAHCCPDLYVYNQYTWDGSRFVLKGHKADAILNP
jgi:hypothetical protein